VTPRAPEPTDEEIAAAVTALVAVLARRAAPRPAAPPRSTWADPAHGFRRPLHPAPGAWASPAGRLT
jgi:Acyl-CoA carboxylase epsilon subunit